MLGAAGLSLAKESDGMKPPAKTIQPEQIQLSQNGWMPNNEHLPVLLYRNVITVEGSDPAAAFEAQFRRNGWPPQCRDGVYDFHHYHSTAHEVLGFAGGYAKIILGGENGHQLEVHAGDVVVLPTGTGIARWRRVLISLWSELILQTSIGIFAGKHRPKKLLIGCAISHFRTLIRFSDAPVHC